ncbi:MAG TPA: S8/S53 family peptidase [Jiangellales bacterium]|nr:S8/S53 family peptidase [Jiangellales bacterium]
MADGERERTRLEEQVERLAVNCRQRTEDPFELGVRWAVEGRRVDYLYRQHRLVCDESDLETVLKAFSAIKERRPPAKRRSTGPVGLVVLDTEGRDAADLADRLSEQIGDDQVVTPVYVLDTQARDRMCPATDPVPWAGDVPVWPEPVGGRRVQVAVVDTGWAEEAASDSGFDRYAAVDRGRSEQDDELYFEDGTIRPYGGHGAATTACVLATAGAAGVTVTVRDVLVGGGVDELAIIEDLVAVVEQGVDVISLQAGFYTAGNREPKSFVNFRRYILAKKRDTVVLAAAGNDGTDRPLWPAAFGYVTAVGALTKGGDARARWSNMGHWVDVYATGEGVVVPYANGRFLYPDRTSAEFTQGKAMWSGTSFSTPYVAGMVARRMIERDVSARRALKQLMQEAQDAALPTTGPRLVF